MIDSGQGLLDYAHEMFPHARHIGVEVKGSWNTDKEGYTRWQLFLVQEGMPDIKLLDSSVERLKIRLDAENARLEVLARLGDLKQVAGAQR